MTWLVFSYSLPSKFNTNSRVRLWRKLRKLGAASPKTGIYILPHREDTLDALRWLASEVEQEQGEALIMQVDRFENLSDEAIKDLFRRERSEDSREIEKFIQELEQEILNRPHQLQNRENVLSFQKEIKKLRKNIEETAKVDFFKVLNKACLMDRLHELQKSLVAGNLVLVIMCSVGTLNQFVLRKMREEARIIPRKEFVQIKRTDGHLAW